LTTADLGNLADGKYEFDEIASRLDRLEAVVMVTPQHLVEWIPLAEDSRERRFELADRLPRVVYMDWDSRTIWLQDGSSQLQLASTKSNALRGYFYDENGQPHAWLSEWKEHHVKIGGAEFFSREARLSEGKQQTVDEAFGDVRLKKYHKLNLKHGSDLSTPWDRARKLGKRMEMLSGVVGPCVPTRLKAWVKGHGARAQRSLKSVEPGLHAWLHGVPADNQGFLLWWHTRKKLWAKPAEVGGLAEQVDLYELKLAPLCALITLDRRVHNAMEEALRELKWDRMPQVADRFVRAGTEQRIVDRLNVLIEERGAGDS